jgi:hypothetical protein
LAASWGANVTCGEHQWLWVPAFAGTTTMFLIGRQCLAR